MPCSKCRASCRCRCSPCHQWVINGHRFLIVADGGDDLFAVHLIGADARPAALDDFHLVAGLEDDFVEERTRFPDIFTAAAIAARGQQERACREDRER